MGHAIFPAFAPLPVPLSWGGGRMRAFVLLPVMEANDFPRIRPPPRDGGSDLNLARSKRREATC